MPCRFVMPWPWRSLPCLSSAGFAAAVVIARQRELWHATEANFECPVSRSPLSHYRLPVMIDGPHEAGRRKLPTLFQGRLRLHYLMQFSCRSEEHTSELQSLMRISYAVFCLKKKNKSNT